MIGELINLYIFATHFYVEIVFIIQIKYSLHRGQILPSMKNLVVLKEKI
jgi:hypothetical protein